MTRPQFSLWQWGTYGFYAILIFGVCVYLTFPSSQLHAWLIAKIDQRFGIQFTVQALQSHTPLRFDIEGSTLSIDPARARSTGIAIPHIHALPIERLDVELHAWPLLRGQGVLSVEIKVFGGVIRGTLIAERSDGQWQYHVLGDSESIYLQQLEERLLEPKEKGQRFSAGTSSFQFDLAWTGANTRSAVGRVSVSIGDTIVNIAGLSPVTLSALSMSVIRDQGGWWRTDDLRVTGDNKGVTANGQGRFLFDESLSSSNINLSVRVTMDDAAKRQYPQLGVFMPGTGEPAFLTVSGTPSRPIVQINGVPILAR